MLESEERKLLLKLLAKICACTPFIQCGQFTASYTIHTTEPADVPSGDAAICQCISAVTVAKPTTRAIRGFVRSERLNDNFSWNR